MNPSSIWSALRAGALWCPALALTAAFAQSAKPVISLDPSDTARVASSAPVKGEASFANAPENFRSFPSAHVGENAYPQQLTLRFSASTQLTKIESTKDFQVQPESGCAAQKFYSAGESCMLVVRFTPQGAGNRLGRITISHSASATPFFVGLNGYGYAPVLSFVPAAISTVPASYPASKGLLSNALNLSIDGGDTLYVADTGNNVVRAMDASGAFTTISSGTVSAPLGVVADTFGEVYFTEAAQNLLFEIYAYGPQFQLNGSTS